MAPQAPAPGRPRRELAFLGAVTALAAVHEFGSYLTSPYRVTDDARQHIFWTYRYQDPALFPGDIFADFFQSMAPWGFRGLYRVAAKVMDPLLFSELLPFALFGLTVWFAWRIGRLLEPRWGGLVAGLLMCEYGGAFRGGLPRAFALAVLVPHFYYLLAGRHGRAGLMLVLQALFYPQVFLNAAGVHGLAVLRVAAAAPGSLAARAAAARRPLAALLAGALLGGASMAVTYLVERPGDMGEVITRAEARERPEFHDGGRVGFFTDDPVAYWLTHDRSGIGWNSRMRSMVIAILVCAFVLGRRAPRVPGLVWDNLLVSVALFLTAHALLFRLHLPNRYTRFTLPISLILLVAALARPAVDALADRWPAVATAGARLARWTPALAAVVLLIMLGAALPKVVRPAPPDPQLVGLYHFAATLPRDALLAGNVVELGNLPLMSRRSVYVDSEFALPYLKGYYREVARRRRALSAALDAASPDDLNRFCDESGVTHLALERASLPAAGRDRGPRERLFENERFLVVPCRREDPRA